MEKGDEYITTILQFVDTNINTPFTLLKDMMALVATLSKSNPPFPQITWPENCDNFRRLSFNGTLISLDMFSEVVCKLQDMSKNILELQLMFGMPTEDFQN